MAKAKAGKKGGKGKGKKTATDNGAPKIITAKGGLTKAQLVGKVLDTMEPDLLITKKQAADFVDSLLAVVEGEIGEGSPVNLFGLVKISPRFHTRGERQVRKEFGNAESPLVTKKYPAKVSVKATVSKAVKDALPKAPTMQKRVNLPK